jgi:hypothetical protein
MPSAPYTGLSIFAGARDFGKTIPVRGGLTTLVVVSRACWWTRVARKIRRKSLRVARRTIASRVRVDETNAHENCRPGRIGRQEAIRISGRLRRARGASCRQERRCYVGPEKCHVASSFRDLHRCRVMSPPHSLTWGVELISRKRAAGSSTDTVSGDRSRQPSLLQGERVIRGKVHDAVPSRSRRGRRSAPRHRPSSAEV